MEQIVTKVPTHGILLSNNSSWRNGQLGLASELERFANDQWLGAHYSEEDASATVMDRFRKMVDQELQLIELRASFERPDA